MTVTCKDFSGILYNVQHHMTLYDHVCEIFPSIYISNYDTVVMDSYDLSHETNYPSHSYDNKCVLDQNKIGKQQKTLVVLWEHLSLSLAISPPLVLRDKISTLMPMLLVMENHSSLEQYPVQMFE